MGPACRGRGARHPPRQAALPRERSRRSSSRARCRAGSRTTSTPRRSATSTAGESRRFSTPRASRSVSGQRRAVPRLAEPARGREPRRPGVPRGAGLHRRARLDRRARSAQRPHHAGVGLLRAAPRGARGEAIPLRRTARRDAFLGRFGRRAPRRVPGCAPRGQADRGGATGCGRGRSRLDARGRRRTIRPARGEPPRRAESRWSSSSPSRTDPPSHEADTIDCHLRGEAKHGFSAQADHRAWVFCI